MPKFSFITSYILRIICELVTYAGVLFCFNVNADVLVVTRLDSELDSLSTQQLSTLWLKQSFYIGEVAVEVTDLPEGYPERKLFYKHVVGKSGNKLSAYWAKQVFRGHGFPPITADSQTAAIEWLKSSKNRLAYINDKKLDKRLDKQLKIVFKLEESPDNRTNEN